VSATLLSPSCVVEFTFVGWLVGLVLGVGVVGVAAVCLLCSRERVNLLDGLGVLGAGEVVGVSSRGSGVIGCVFLLLLRLGVTVGVVFGVFWVLLNTSVRVQGGGVLLVFCFLLLLLSLLVSCVCWCASCCVAVAGCLVLGMLPVAEPVCCSEPCMSVLQGVCCCGCCMLAVACARVLFAGLGDTE
jgi:hypothetical protein